MADLEMQIREAEITGIVRDLRGISVGYTCSGSHFLTGVYADSGERCFLKYYPPGRAKEAEHEKLYSDRFHRTVEAVGARFADAVRVRHLIGLSDGAVLLVMDFIEGDLILDLIDAGKALGAERSATVRRAFLEMAQVLQALDQMHRDVCPKNLMLSGDRLILFDFETATERACPVVNNPSLKQMKNLLSLGYGFTHVRGDWNDSYALLCAYEDLRPILTVPDFAADIRQLYDMAERMPTFRARFTVTEAWKQRMRPVCRKMMLRPRWTYKEHSLEKHEGVIRLLRLLLGAAPGEVLPADTDAGAEPPAPGVLRTVLWSAGEAASAEAAQAETETVRVLKRDGAAVALVCRRLYMGPRMEALRKTAPLSVAELDSVRKVNVSSPDAVAVVGLRSFETLVSDAVPDAPMVLCVLPGDVRRLRFRGRRSLAHLRRICRLVRTVALPDADAVQLFRRKMGWDDVMPEVLPQTEIAGPEALPGLCRSAAVTLPPLCALALRRCFDNGSVEYLGDGTRRVCNRIPGQPYCVKFYRSGRFLRPDTPESLLREFDVRRHDEHHNTCCEEYDYFHDEIKTGPEFIRHIFPDTVEKLYLPGMGWGILESLVMNADGSPVQKVSEWLKTHGSAEDHRRIAQWMHDIYHAFYAHAVRFFDLQNLFIQFLEDGSFCIRLTDFEPRTRTLIQPETFGKAFVRMKFRRRFRRFWGVLNRRIPGLPAFPGD